MKKRQIVDALLVSIRDANVEYEEMSGGQWLSDCGTEGFLVSHIARELFKILKAENASVTLETCFETVRECSAAKGTPGPKLGILAETSRVDVVIWDNRERVTGVIEVKRTWTADACLRDIERLVALMSRYGPEKGGSLELACFVCFVRTACDPDGSKLGTKYGTIRDRIAQVAKQRIRFRTLEPVCSQDVGTGEGSYAYGGVVAEFY
jgi:hypothetical protein